MEVVSTITDLQSVVDRFRADNKKIGLVPTMGYLHEGHLSLVDQCKRQADVVIVTIFVNPTQFGPNEDLDAYPRDLDRDLSLCEARGADLVFAPQTDDVYASSHSTFVDEEKASLGLCGGSRPGHFRGVLTIVAKLFNMTRCDVAVFGQKDAQQVTIIEKMVNDLNMPVQIVRVPIAREADGLAMSSRNAYLTQDERKIAPVLHESIRLGKQLIKDGNTDTLDILRQMNDLITQQPGIRLDYLEIVDRVNLQKLKNVKPGDGLIAGAIFVGKTRLIDNMEV